MCSSDLEAVIRETLEETALPFTPQALLGVYVSRFLRPGSGEDLTYLRLAFRGTVGAQPVAGRALDEGIVRVLWLTPEELRENQHRLRSPLVLRCMLDHLAGHAYPLETITTHDSVWQPQPL